jgi:MFS family permease
VIKSPGAILALLTGLNLLNYLDRMVLSAVLPRMQPELGLSNFESGLLATIFLIGYFATSPIFGALGDRVQRKGLIALGIIIWSVATIASGLVTGVLPLLFVRAMVGVGEASYATLAPTIIDDITPTEKKGRALSIFFAATPIGAALGYIIGGQVEHFFGWRAAFFVAGGPGLLLSLVCLMMKEPARKLRTEKPNLKADFATLVKTPVYRTGVLGYCAYTAAIGAFSFWAPKFLFARYGVPLAKANTVYGAIIVVAGGLGTVLGGRWADRNAKRIDAEHHLPPPDPEKEKLFREQGDRAPTDEQLAKRAAAATRARLRDLLRICAIGSAIAAPIAFAEFMAPRPELFFGLSFFTITSLFLCTSPVNAICLQSVPPELRASAMALCIFAIHVLGDLWSPPFVGILADHLPIQLAMMTLPVAIASSAVIWWPRKAVTATNN